MGPQPHIGLLSENSGHNFSNLAPEFTLIMFSGKMVQIIRPWPRDLTLAHVIHPSNVTTI